jgi:nucleotide-binding universal stress UspA family protein
MGGRDRDQPAGSTATATFESLLMQSGRPVIVVPTGVPLPANPKRVVLAWQPSREATRVAHDILPLLTPDTHVELLIIDPEKSRGEERDGPGERIAQKLANQGVPVRIVAKPRQARSDGEDLVRYVEASDADLLAMGGYGHSRLREIILGGTTRAVLDTMSKPVFFEH